jgi:tetratricopeptide (TPR) repeat protein
MIHRRLNAPPSRSFLAARAIAAVIVLAATTWLCGQNKPSKGSASISGTVKDAHQQPASGVDVTLQSDSQPQQSIRSDEKGRYTFSSLPAGVYTIRAKGSTMAAANHETIALAEGEKKVVDVVLVDSAGKGIEFYDEPKFTVAGVSESSGAGVHGSTATMRNTDALTKAAASLGQGGGGKPAASASANEVSIQELREKIAANDQSQLHNQLAHVEEASGHPLEALQEFQRAAEMDPSEMNLFDWGTELLAHHAAEPAVDVFTKGTRQYPRSVRMLTGLAVAEYARGAYAAAVERIGQASDLDPGNPIPYEFLGKMENAEVRRSPNALAKLARFAELHPDNPAANYYYAVALWNQTNGTTDVKSVALVEKLLKRAIELDPKFAAAYLQSGIVESSREQFSEATSALEHALTLEPDLAEAYYRLAQIYRRAGDEAKARQELAAYQRLSAAADEDAERQRKAMQQFVYELRTPTPSTQPQ